MLKLFDDYRSTGEASHSSLPAAALMASEDRPAILSRQTFDMLDDLRAFRHIVHKADAKPLDWPRMQHLATSAAATLRAVSDDLSKFDVFLAEALRATELPDYPG